jgi:hypothetical protein
LKEVIGLATTEEYLNAAKKRPSARTTAEQRLVDDGSNMQAVRNADFAAKQEEQVYGPVRS